MYPDIKIERVVVKAKSKRIGRRTVRRWRGKKFVMYHQWKLLPTIDLGMQGNPYVVKQVSDALAEELL